MSKVLFIENHGELFRISRFRLMKVFSDFVRLLKKNRYEVKNFRKGAITNFDLGGYDVIILGLPQKGIFQEEIQAIYDFIFDGGGLLLIGGAPIQKSIIHITVDIKSLNQLASEFGIEFDYNLLTGGKNSLSLGGFPRRPPFPIVTKFSPHPIIKGISELVIIDGAPLRIKGKVQAIAVSDPDTIPPSSIVLATVQFGKGRIVAISSPYMFLRMSVIGIPITHGLYKPDHLVFAMNVIDWLVYRK
ncbi:MAG: hypothetical protein HWN65_15600 [Candidatus Helarchaeota archaeon]|nr:hypothetical protein [Candidatus Helarchaeota archaeon]